LRSARNVAVPCKRFMTTVTQREPLPAQFDRATPARVPETGVAAPRRPSVFEIGRNCEAIARAGRVAFLVDGEAYFKAFMSAAERAQRSILILAWDFDSRTGLCFDRAGKCLTTMGDFLNGLARKRRRLTVRVLDWDYPMVFGSDREFPPVYGMDWQPHR